MKRYQINWDTPAGTCSEQYRARDAEHAIKQWKRDHPKLSTRTIEHVWRLSR